MRVDVADILHVTKLNYISLSIYNHAHNGRSTCYNLIQWSIHGQSATSTSHVLLILLERSHVNAHVQLLEVRNTRYTCSKGVHWKLN